MSGLSNFFKSRDPDAAVVRPVGPGEIEPALRLLLGTNGHPTDSAIAANFEGIARLRGIDLTTIQVAAIDQKIIAASLSIDNPGGTALLMLSTAGNSSALARCVARCGQASVAALSDGPPVLVQALVEPQESAVVEAMVAQRFELLATLIYLQRSCDRSLAMPGLPRGFSVQTYSPQTHQAFALAIEASYTQSLDCPPLHGRRATDDVIAGHRATGEFSPDLWFCLLEENRPIALLLLAPVSGHASMELVYLGIAPAARGKKMGDYLVKRALAQTYAAGLEQLTLAVDSANTPALRLYHRHGMAEVHRRMALMCEVPARKDLRYRA